MTWKKFNIYRFLPIQLFLLHFRKFQLLLVFWLVLFAILFGHFMAHFGAASLFLSPEYLGKTSALSFFLLGGAIAIFTMSWHITTFIMHSKRIPFLGATRHSFVKYCLNNSLLPFIYLLVFGITAWHYLRWDEGYSNVAVLLMLAGFYLGFTLILLVSFLYFFSVDRNILKTVLSSIGSLTAITGIIPFDTLDVETDQVHADTYWNNIFEIKKIERPYHYNTRFLATVLRRHHRNAVFAIVIAYLCLLTLGVFMEHPVLRIPAGSGFLLLFSIAIAFVGSFKYLLRSWEVTGWIAVFAITAFLVHLNVFDLRSTVQGIRYNYKNAPVYDYDHLKKIFDSSAIKNDELKETQRLEAWKKGTHQERPTLLVVAVSGGGSRSAFWSFRCLQYADSLSGGALFKHTVLVTGASGGMIGASFWDVLHTESNLGKIKNVYNPTFQKDIGKDLLNAIVFSMVAVDFISPFNKITINGKRYGKDRGYALDKELGTISNGLLNKRISYFQPEIDSGQSPLLVINATIINDGRKLMIAPRPISYLTTAKYNADNLEPIVDAVDFGRFFHNENAMNLKLSSALRMSASFPFILPVVKLPSKPQINIMDAGLRDNYGMETSTRYLNYMRNWLLENCGNIILLQIRDTKESEPSKPDRGKSLADMVFDPLFAIEQKWSAFQTFSQTYLLDETHETFPADRFHKIVLEFEPSPKGRSVALNFHLSTKDKTELSQGIYSKSNQAAIKQLLSLLKGGKPH